MFQRISSTLHVKSDKQMCAIIKLQSEIYVDMYSPSPKIATPKTDTFYENYRFSKIFGEVLSKSPILGQNIKMMVYSAILTFVVPNHISKQKSKNGSFRNE